VWTACIVVGVTYVSSGQDSGAGLNRAALKPQLVDVENLWTYRIKDGVQPSEPGTVFLVLPDDQEPAGRRLLIGSQSMLLRQLPMKAEDGRART
jgi:hypothetical protein